MDLDTQLIAAAAPTPANVNETTVADQLLTGRERSVHADRAYDAAAREALYRRTGGSSTRSCGAATSTIRCRTSSASATAG